MINRRGEVVALNAGGRNKAASAFYLPLERVVRALKLLQVQTARAWPIPFLYAPLAFAEHAMDEGLPAGPPVLRPALQLC